jgi:hypothetical protein
MDQHDLLIKIRETIRSSRGSSRSAILGLIPNPAASEVALKRAEKRLKHKLPPSYRAFLSVHDGWPRFFDAPACSAPPPSVTEVRGFGARGLRSGRDSVAELGPPRRRGRAA